MKKEQIDNLVTALVREQLVNEVGGGYKLTDKGLPIFLDILKRKLQSEMKVHGLQLAQGVDWFTLLDETLKTMEEEEYNPVMFLIDHYSEVMEMKGK